MNRPNFQYALIGLLLACTGSANAAGPLNPPLKTVTVTIGKQSIVAEVADTPETRETGLMNRGNLPDNKGMLFVFQDSQPHCMWMKNTPNDLDVAFADAEGQILNVENMKAETLDIHCAKGFSVYALEMRSGWFKDHKVKRGDFMDIKKPR
ncbi:MULTISPECIES: DUF192 domain-containing protein [Limnobacter]|uniref:DUF192 domain-containing protein n=1 Tax=Limnobacter TaxID=131079 RepID=UPI0024E1684A|nr:MULTISPECIES: DUF192 domain-containing protein [Limnobacter]